MRNTQDTKITLHHKGESIMAMDKFNMGILRTDDLKFEKSNRKSSFFYGEKSEIVLDKTKGKSEVEKFLDRVLAEGLERKASDIHIEPFSSFFRVRYRVDGILLNSQELKIEYYPPVVSKIKIMCGLDITERRMAQDGRFNMKYKDKTIDFRVGIIPTYHGEKAVIRILDGTDMKKSLEELGFDGKNYRKFYETIQRKNGMILFTGPMGSGKTTSMYALLNRLNSENINITTIENPVEYSIDGINQIQCREDIGLTFSAVLKGILRQDADVIMIGEIRDKETAETALRASLTGHLVISTIHTGTSSGTIKRLIDLGVEPYIISAGVRGIQNQRLVRNLCPHCKKKDEDFINKLKLLGIDYEKFTEKIFYTHLGCEKCNFTGYSGRSMIGEFLFVDENIMEKIEKGVSAREIEKEGIRQGMKTLAEVGVEKALAGITSLDELIKEC